MTRSNIVDDYFSSLHALLDTICEKESENVQRVASAAAESISKGGVLHVFDTGHMLSSELIGRAGGLLAWSPLSFSLAVNNPNKHRDARAAAATSDLDRLVALALGRSHLRAGDLLFVGSVSGKTPMPVEVALQGKSLGATVVALTSVEHSSLLAPEHSSGKRLYEVADIVLDNHAPPGDAMLEIKGLERRCCPASGIAAASLMWSVNAATVEALVRLGVEPTVYRSVNLAGGPDDVKQTEARYAEKGY